MNDFIQFPHTRGDEPNRPNIAVNNCHSFPTHVGMNRIAAGAYLCDRQFPHTRGDEPTAEELQYS